MAPVCSSFTFANTANTKRTRTDFSGDPSCPSVSPLFFAELATVTQQRHVMKQQMQLRTHACLTKVQAGNHMAEVAVFLLMVAAARGVHACLENPAGSMLFSYVREHLEPLQPLLATSIADRCHYSGEPVGSRYKKPYKFLATGKWIHAVSGRCQCIPRQHIALMKTDARGRSSGTSGLKASQAYPDKLGQALVAAWAGTPGVPACSPVGDHAPTGKRRTPSNAAASHPKRRKAANPASSSTESPLPGGSTGADSPGPWPDDDMVASGCGVAGSVEDAPSSGPWGGSESADSAPFDESTAQ